MQATRAETLLSTIYPAVNHPSPRHFSRRVAKTPPFNSVLAMSETSRIGAGIVGPQADDAVKMKTAGLSDVSTITRLVSSHRPSGVVKRHVAGSLMRQRVSGAKAFKRFSVTIAGSFGASCDHSTSNEPVEGRTWSGRGMRVFFSIGPATPGRVS